MGMLVSGNLFPLMGVEPTIGRGFRPDEDQVPGRDAVVVLGRRLWEQEFGSDPVVLGRRVRINGTEFTVIGVAPAEFTGLDQFVRSDFFVPLMMSPRLIADPKASSLEARDVRNLRLKGRLQAGRHAGGRAGGTDDDRRRSGARLSRHQQESAARGAHRAAGADRRPIRRTRR